MRVRDLVTAKVATLCGIVLLTVAFATFSTVAYVAYADPIGPNCDTCQGSVYTLSYNGTTLPDADPLHETFRIMYTINTSGYTGGGLRIDNVAVKVSSSVFAASLVNAPGGAGGWNLVSGGINASGCDGSGSGFECADDTGTADAPTFKPGPGATYNWVFDITGDNGALFTGLNAASIKARYVDASGNKVGDLVSEDITLQVKTPEASTTVLLGIALFGLVVLSRKKFMVQS